MSKKPDPRQATMDFNAPPPPQEAAEETTIETMNVSTQSVSDVMILLMRVSKGRWNEIAVSFDGKPAVLMSNIITNLNNPADSLRLVKAMDNAEKNEEDGRIIYDVPQIFITNEAKPAPRGDKSDHSRFKAIPIIEHFDHTASLSATITNYTGNEAAHLDGTSYAVLVSEIDLSKKAGELPQDADNYQIQFEAVLGTKFSLDRPPVKMPTPQDIAYAKLGLPIPKHE